MAVILAASIVVVIALLVWVMITYNKLVKLRNRVDNSWADIDVQLKRRHDLIPNLVSVVSGYATHEQDTLTAVTEARAAAVGVSSTNIGPDIAVVRAAQTAEGALTNALSRLLLLQEAYPDLKADQQFVLLQQQLAETETKVAVSRQIYNDVVLRYNNKLQVFPTNLIASRLRFMARTYFQIEQGAAVAPNVSFEATP